MDVERLGILGHLVGDYVSIWALGLLVLCGHVFWVNVAILG